MDAVFVAIVGREEKPGSKTCADQSIALKDSFSKSRNVENRGLPTGGAPVPVDETRTREVASMTVAARRRGPMVTIVVVEFDAGRCWTEIGHDDLNSKTTFIAQHDSSLILKPGASGPAGG